jgi:hypothetical protein
VDITSILSWVILYALYQNVVHFFFLHDVFECVTNTLKYCPFRKRKIFFLYYYLLVHLEHCTFMSDPLKFSKWKCIVKMCLKSMLQYITPYLIYCEKISVESMKWTLIHKVPSWAEYHRNKLFSITNILSSDSIYSTLWQVNSLVGYACSPEEHPIYWADLCEIS